MMEEQTLMMWMSSSSRQPQGVLTTGTTTRSTAEDRRHRQCRRRSLSRGVFPTTSMMAFSWLLVALLLLVLHVNNNGPHKHRGMLVQGFVLLPINTHHREVLSSSLLTRRLALLFHGNGDAPESNDHNVINNDNNNNHNNQNQQQQPQPLSKEEQQRLFDPDRLALLQRLSSVDGDGSHNETGSSPDTVMWEVYVDQSKASLDRGGSATLDAMWVLAPPSLVRVIPALLPKTAKLKGPVLRCLHVLPPTDSITTASSYRPSFEVTNVDSVDKVFRILTRHMRIPGIDVKACDCLKWKYRANGHLEAGRIALAIETYDKAVMAATYIANPTIQMQQEGTILLMRATAYLQRAKEHKLVLQKIVQELDAIPEQPDAMIPLLDAVVMMGDRSIPALGPPLFRRMISDTRHYEKVFRRTQYRHGLYQYALLHAAQDSLRATQLCPAVPQAWLRAAETLADLWKVSESAQYYQQAQRLDETLAPTVQVVIDKLQRRQELLDHARAYGWSEDTLRLALDVAG